MAWLNWKQNKTIKIMVIVNVIGIVVRCFCNIWNTLNWVNLNHQKWHTNCQMRPQKDEHKYWLIDFQKCRVQPKRYRFQTLDQQLTNDLQTWKNWWVYLTVLYPNVIEYTERCVQWPSILFLLFGHIHWQISDSLLYHQRPSNKTWKLHFQVILAKKSRKTYI